MSVTAVESDDRRVDARCPPAAGVFGSPFASTSPPPVAAYPSRSPPARVLPGAAPSTFTSISTCKNDLQSPRVAAASSASDSGLNRSPGARTLVQPTRSVYPLQHSTQKQPQPTQFNLLRRTSSYKQACDEHEEVAEPFNYNYTNEYVGYVRSPSEQLQLHELDASSSASGVGGDQQAERAASLSNTFWYREPRRSSFRASVLAIFVLDVLLTALMPVLARSPAAPPPESTVPEILVLLLALYALFSMHSTRDLCNPE